LVFLIEFRWFCAVWNAFAGLDPTQVVVGGETTLFSFNVDHHGGYPISGLVQVADGELYGTTSVGGADGPYLDSGTVFKISLDGKLTTLVSFCSADPSCAQDGYPPSTGLIRGTDGDLYGTTGSTFFKLPHRAPWPTLYKFCGQPDSSCAVDGWDSSAGVIQASD
jgi:uncharacterized repeat protein (TIGR03803 family)